MTWKSNKQSFVARSSVEAEFKALTQGICEILLLKLALEELKVSHGDPMKLYCDNRAAVSIFHNLFHHDCTKHVDGDKHFIKEKIEKGIICMSYVPTFEQAIDLLTKGLGRPMFEKLVNGVVSCIVVGDMLLRERARECESEGEGDGDEGDNQMEKWRKRQGKSFGVESKVFEVEVEKRRGKTLLFIVESKKGVSSWVRLGPASARIFLEGLDRCVKDGKEDKWEKGRSYSMVREVNKAGSFIRLGVVDAEEKRYSICISRGRGERGGWSAMAEVVRDLIARLDRREEKKEESIPVRLQAKMGKRWGNRGSLLVRMEVEGEEISRNVNRLEHCLVGKWNPRVAGGENLARLGWLMASAWGLKGKLGLA